MGFVDDAYEQLHDPERRCLARRLIDELPYRAEVYEALQNPELTGAAIARALAARDVHVSNETLNLHRRGGCACRS